MSPRSKRIGRRVLIAAVALAALVVTAHFAVMATVRKLVNVPVEFGSDLDEAVSRQTVRASVDEQRTLLDPADFAELAPPAPFREIDVLDEEAKDWSSFFDGYAATGALVFDANGDGWMDLYLSHNNNTWVRPTDGRGVIVDRPRISGNGLYINRGVGADGLPRFERPGAGSGFNGNHQREELLVEDFLEPRESVADPFDGRIGRASSTALAADLDADGRMDLVVGNILPGMLWSHPKTQRVLGQFVRPVGRQAVKTKTPLSAQGLYFVKDYEAGDEIDDVRETPRGLEPIGANSVFLNLGDRDGDGFPEWRDVSAESGLQGRRNTMALMAADFDLDGDLDIFEANIMDMDYWPGGATALAGAANQLYLNQLAETGELRFIERAAEYDVDGLYDEGNPTPDYYRLRRVKALPAVYSIALRDFEPYQPEFLELNGERSEPGQISWAAVTQDVNLDGYPDIWVANDLGFLRLHVNQEGKGFKLDTSHPWAGKTGYWMSFSPADFNGDAVEDLFAGNMGGATMNLAMPIPDLFSLFNPVMSSSTLTQQFFSGTHHSMHAIYDGATGFSSELDSKVRHSSVLPPDASLPNNVRNFVVVGNEKVDFDRTSLDPYEFTWGSTSIDVQNDGRQDVYWIGCLQGRGGGTFPIMGTGPGRLLVNATRDPAVPRFVDQTAEHHLFNMLELQYDKLADEGYIYRRSPLQNWGKRSMVHSYDVSVWGFQGPGIVERITNHDLIQTSENGRAAVAADLDNNGYADIVVRNIGGYDSRSSKSVNLKARVGDSIEVIPAHDANFPSPTNYEPGSTRVFLNTYRGNRWLKVRLVDETSLNRDAVGAQVVVNGSHLQVLRAGGGGFISNTFGPLLFGLGAESAVSLEVRWPDRERTVTRLELPGYHGGVLTVGKDGATRWEAAG